MDRVLPQLDEQLCTRCGLCVEACPCGAAELGETGVTFSCPDACTDAETCDCGCLCEEVCPAGAISIAFEIVLGEGER
jgi:ferredoxin